MRARRVVAAGVPCWCWRAPPAADGASKSAGPATSTTRPAPPTTATTLPRRAVDPVTGAGPGVNVYAHTGAGMLSPAVAGVPTRVYVPNSLSNTRRRDRPDDLCGSSTTSRSVSRPQHVVPSYDLKTLYVNNNRGNSLTPIDPMTGRPGRADPGRRPVQPVLHARRHACDRHGGAQLARRLPRPEDVRAHQVRADRARGREPRGLHAEREGDDRELRVLRAGSSASTSTTMTVTGELNVGGMPVDVKSSPDGTVMYVANQGRSGVSIVDPVTMREVGFIPTGSGAHGLYAEPRRHPALRDEPARGFDLGDRLRDRAGRRHLADRRDARTWAGSRADGTQLWVTGRYSNSVYVVDTAYGPAHGHDPGRQRPPRSGPLPPTRPVQPGPHRQLPLRRVGGPTSVRSAQLGYGPRRSSFSGGKHGRPPSPRRRTRR